MYSQHMEYTTGLHYWSLPLVFTMGTCYQFLLPFTTSILDILEISIIGVYTTAVYTTGVDTTSVDTTGVETTVYYIF